MRTVRVWHVYEFVCVSAAQNTQTLANTPLANDSEPHRRSLAGGGGPSVCARCTPQAVAGVCTTAFAFFGEVKAVSGKFWLRPGVRSLARSYDRTFAKGRVGRVTFLSPPRGAQRLALSRTEIRDPRIPGGPEIPFSRLSVHGIAGLITPRNRS